MLHQSKIPNIPSDEKSLNGDLLQHASCARCGGLLVSTFCITPDQGTCDFQIPVAKCLQCGDVIDPVILKHRFSSTPPEAHSNKGRRWATLQAISKA